MKIGILTSGGDAPGMNAAIRSIVRTCIYNDSEAYGIYGGFEGLIDGNIKQLVESSVADIIQRGGTILGTSRSERFKTEEGFQKALKVIEIFQLDGIIVCGGDGSLKGALELAKGGIPVAGIPVSIDNDLAFTDYTIGFCTAVQTVTAAISNIRDTTEAHGRANVVEVMGRDCGDIALYSGLAGGAESIIVPEQKLDYDEIARRAVLGKNRGKKHHIIVMAEGAGSAYDFAETFQEMTGIDTRVTILGYIQRGGSPSIYDRIMASEMGYQAVEELLNGKKNFAVGIKNSKVFTQNLDAIFHEKKKFNDYFLKILKTISI